MQFRSLSLSDLVLSKVPRLRHSRTQLVILVMRHWHSFWLFGYSLVAKTMSDNGCVDQLGRSWMADQISVLLVVFFLLEYDTIVDVMSYRTFAISISWQFRRPTLAAPVVSTSHKARWKLMGGEEALCVFPCVPIIHIFPLCWSFCWALTQTTANFRGWELVCFGIAVTNLKIPKSSGPKLGCFGVHRFQLESQLIAVIALLGQGTSC